MVSAFTEYMMLIMGIASGPYGARSGSLAGRIKGT